MGLLRTLLVILIIYYALKIVSRYILPIILKSAVNKVQKNMNQQQAAKQDNTKVGETTVDYTPNTSSKTANVGEYIDFEEVKDTKTKKD
jgi:cellulase/cellobiase CelA1